MNKKANLAPLIVTMSVILLVSGMYMSFENLENKGSLPVTGFTTIVGGGGNLSTLIIFDDLDLTGRRGTYNVSYTFYANYSNTTDSVNITGATCDINFTDESSVMTYNATSTFYEYTRNFSTSGTKYYNVSCNVTLFEQLNATDEYLVINALPLVSNLILNSTTGNNYTKENLTVYWNLTDANNDAILNITNWLLEGVSISVLNMPFSVDGTNNATDYSTYGHTITVNGATWNSTGGYNEKGAYSFDGTDTINLSTEGPLNIAGNITIVAWVNRASGNDGTILHRNQQYSLRILGDGKLAWADSSSWGFDPFGFHGTVTDSEWHHIAVSKASSNITFYVDGQDVGSALVGSEITTTGAMTTIGCFADDSGACTQLSYSGLIDELLVFNRSLSPQQIKLIYENRTDILSSKELKAGENWSACITPNDGTANGETVCSNNVTIVTTPDFTPPSWLETPQNITSQYGYSVYYDVNATDDIQVDSYWIGDIENFSIEQLTGVIQNATALYLGNYSLNISVNDTSGKESSVLINVDVGDATNPAVNVNSPLNNTFTNVVDVNFSINVSDNLNLSNATIYIYNQTDLYNTSFFDLTGLTESMISVVVNLAMGVYNWFVVLIDSAGNINQTANYTLILEDTPPYIYDVNATNMSTSATITFYTNETTNYTINYGDSVSLGNYVSSSSYSLSHEQALTGLNPSTVYYYNITAFDQAGNYILNGTFELRTTDFPSVIQLVVNSTFGTNLTTENLTVYWNLTTLEGFSIKNITDWRINGTSIAALNLPFETDSSLVKDYSSNGEYGTNNGATWNSTGGFDERGAYVFDGSDTMNFSGTGSSNIVGNLTLAVWVKHSSGNDGTVIHKDGQYTLRILNDNNILWAESSFWRDYDQFGRYGPLVADEWHHVAMIRAGTNLTMYLDGEVLHSQILGSEITSTSNAMVVGCSANGAGTCSESVFAGTIDNLLLYDRAISYEQLRLIFENQSNVLSEKETELGENWTACITPSNGTVDGVTVCSGNLTIMESSSDSTAPAISNIFNISISNESALINWSTDESANASINYGINESLGNTYTNDTLLTEHSYNITGLLNATTYYYNITTCDASGNCNLSGPWNFITAQNLDLVAPVISDLINISISNESAVINFTTDELANTSINYGINESLGTFVLNDSLVLSHNQNITGLLNYTTYYYNITTCDASGNCNISGPWNFITEQNAALTVYPNITSISPNTTNETMAILDETNISIVTTGNNQTFNVTIDNPGYAVSFTWFVNGVEQILNIISAAFSSAFTYFFPATGEYNISVVVNGSDSALNDTFTWTTNHTCIDNDGDGFYSDCEPIDCNDDDYNLVPPSNNYTINRSITFCPGNYTANNINFTTSNVALTCNGTIINQTDATSLSMNYVSNVNITGCYFDRQINTQYVIRARNSFNLTFRDNLFKPRGSSGMYLINSTNMLFVNNSFFNGIGYILELENISGAEFYNNSIYNCSSSYTVYAHDWINKFIFIGNSIINSTYGPMMSGVIGNSTVSSNFMSTLANHALRFGDAENLVISYNVVENVTGGNDGVYVGTACTNCSIIGNNFTRIGNNGIEFQGSVVNSTIAGNIINISIRGIYLNGVLSSVVANNTVYNSTYDGMWLATSSNNTFENNQFSYNANSGMYISSSSDNTFSNNTFSNNTKDIEILGTVANTFKFVNNQSELKFERKSFVLNSSGNNMYINPSIVAINITAEPNLNTSAEITFTGLLASTTPTIYRFENFTTDRDTVISLGAECDETNYCQNITYSSGTLKFNVTGFSSYVVPDYCAGSDSDGDGFYDTFTEGCRAIDCNDNNYNIVPPVGDYDVNRSLTYCPGTFNVTDKIVFTAPNVTLTCNSTVIRQLAEIINISYVSNITIEGCTIEKYNASTSSAIYAYNSINITLRNNTIQTNKTATSCMLLQNITDLLIVNNTLFNAANGMYLIATANARVHNNSISNTSSYGIYTLGTPRLTTNFELVGNRIFNMSAGSGYYEPIGFEGSAVISSNTIQNSPNLGIYVQYLKNSIISNNVIDNASGFGLQIVLYCENCSITGNNISKITNQAMLLGKIINSTISGNNLDSHGYGVYTTGMNYSTLFNNRIGNSVSPGFAVFLQSSHNNSIQNNYIYNATYGGLYLSGSSDNYLYNNTFYNNTKDIFPPAGTRNTYVFGNSLSLVKFENKDSLVVNDTDNFYFNSSIVALNTTADIGLNTTAEITFTGLSDPTTPTIYRYEGFTTNKVTVTSLGTECTAANYCPNITYSSGTLKFNVTGFSSYAVEDYSAPAAPSTPATTTTSSVRSHSSGIMDTYSITKTGQKVEEEIQVEEPVVEQPKETSVVQPVEEKSSVKPEEKKASFLDLFNTLKYSAMRFVSLKILIPAIAIIVLLFILLSRRSVSNYADIEENLRNSISYVRKLIELGNKEKAASEYEQFVNYHNSSPEIVKKRIKNEAQQLRKEAESKLR